MRRPMSLDMTHCEGKSTGDQTEASKSTTESDAGREQAKFACS